MRPSPLSTSPVVVTPVFGSVVDVFDRASRRATSPFTEKYTGESPIGRSLRESAIRGELPLTLEFAAS